MSDPVLIHAANARKAGRKWGIDPAVILGILSVEGGTNPDGTPKAPADGKGPASYGQFTYGTGAQLGVKYGDSASETDAIGRYLVQLGYKDYPQRAIAAYNGGPRNPQFGYAREVMAAAKHYAGVGDAPATSGGTPAPAAGGTPPASSAGLFGTTERSGAVRALLYTALALAGLALAGLGITRTAGLKGSARVSSIIGTPYTGTHTLGNWQSDDAYDIATPVGTPMIAAADGTVIKVTKHPQDNSRFAGDQITIKTTDGNEFFYAHGVATVKPGQQIKAGDTLGTTGSANGVAHLHFAALTNPKQFLDNVLGGGQSVLDKVGGVLGKLPNPANPAAVPGAIVGGVIGAGGALQDKAAGAATDVAKAAVGALWDAVGADGARALLYALLVFGGVALAVAGIARATGVGQKLRTAATTAAAVTPAGRGAAVAGAAL